MTLSTSWLFNQNSYLVMIGNTARVTVRYSKFLAIKKEVFWDGFFANQMHAKFSGSGSSFRLQQGNSIWIYCSVSFFFPQAITESSDTVWQNRREDERKWLYKCLEPEMYLLLEFMNLEVKNIFSPYDFYVTTLLQSNVKCLEMYRLSCWHN